MQSGISQTSDDTKVWQNPRCKSLAPNFACDEEIGIEALKSWLSNCKSLSPLRPSGQRLKRAACVKRERAPKMLMNVLHEARILRHEKHVAERHKRINDLQIGPKAFKLKHCKIPRTY